MKHILNRTTRALNISDDKDREKGTCILEATSAKPSEEGSLT